MFFSDPNFEPDQFFYKICGAIGLIVVTTLGSMAILSTANDVSYKKLNQCETFRNEEIQLQCIKEVNK